MSTNNKKSLWMLALSMVIFGSVGVFRRFIPLPSSSLAFFRGILGALFLLVAAKLQKKRINHHIGTKKILWLVITGAAIGVNWILLFEAYHYTTVATATSATICSPPL